MTELNYQAQQDPLTGLYNHRYFNELLESEIERSKRYNHDFGLLMLDLDRFKTINDTYGHLHGDTVLQDIARILKNKIRCGDIIARLGGDEFIILLPETGATGTYHVAKEIKKAIKVHQFLGDQNCNITSSIGIVSYSSGSTSQIELLSHVDLALYQVKSGGRDTICVYDSSSIA